MTSQHESLREASRGRTRLLVELWASLTVTKKRWLAPTVAVLVLVGLLVALSGTAVAPFIYTIF